MFPHFFYVDITFVTASYVLLLNSYYILIVSRVLRASRLNKVPARVWIEFGLSAGVLALFRSETPLLVLLTMLYIVYCERERLKVVLRPMFFSALICAAILTPWTIRNYAVFGRVIPGSTNGGFNF